MYSTAEAIAQGIAAPQERIHLRSADNEYQHAFITLERLRDFATAWVAAYSHDPSMAVPTKPSDLISFIEDTIGLVFYVFDSHAQLLCGTNDNMVYRVETMQLLSTFVNPDVSPIVIEWDNLIIKHGMVVSSDTFYGTLEPGHYLEQQRVIRYAQLRQSVITPLATVVEWVSTLTRETFGLSEADPFGYTQQFVDHSCYQGDSIRIVAGDVFISLFISSSALREHVECNIYCDQDDTHLEYALNALETIGFTRNNWNYLG